MYTKSVLFVFLAIIFISVCVHAQITNTAVVTVTKDQSETAIAISPANSSHIMAVWNDYRKEVQDTVFSKPGFAFSTNGGSTWMDSILTDASGDHPIDGFDPSCAFGRNDTAYYCYVRSQGQGGSIYIARTTNLGPPWAIDTIIWNSTRADKPYMTVDNTNHAFDGSVYASWYDGRAVKFSFSRDRLASYTVLTIDSTNSLVHSPIPVVGADGKVYVVWVDRSTGKHKLRRSTNGGSSFLSGVVEIDTLYKYIDVLYGAYDLNSWPSVAADPTTASNLYIVYTDQASSTDTSRRIWFKRSIDSGATWHDKKIIGDFGGTGWQFHPAITASSTGQISVSFFHTLVTDSIANVYTTVSTDQGISFQMVPRRITNVGSYVQYATNHLDYMGSASLQTHAYPLWTDTRNGSPSSKNANVYSAALDLSPTNQISDNSVATAYGGAPKTLFSSRSNKWNLIYQSGGDLYYTYSIDSGATWSFAEIISGYAGNGSGGIADNSNPALAEDTSGALHVVYARASGLYYNYKPLNGSWQASPIQLIADIGLTYPSFTVDPTGTGHIVYVRYVDITESLSGISYVYYGNFTLSTSDPNFTEVVQLYNAGHTIVSMTSLTQLSNGQLHTVWAKGGEIWYSYGSGTSWLTVANISNTSGLSTYPSMMSYNRNGYEIYVVWQEHVSSSNDEIYYRLNTNGTWGNNQNLSQTSSGLSQYPYIAGFKLTGSTDTALVMWAEKPSGGNYDIYYILLSRSSAKPLDNTSTSSLYPAFACKSSTNRLLAVWTEGNASPYAIVDTTLDNSIVKNKTRMGAGAAESEATVTPYRYSLEQNYPNPFNPTTEFHFSIADPKTFVRLSVYDVLGQEVAVVVNELKNQGDYHVTWKCEYCPSGVYFYRLLAGSFFSTKKMLLIR